MRVIKIERPGTGDFARDYDHTPLGQSSYFAWLNRGKESVQLDVKDPGDRDLLLRLIDSADVFVQNLAPGAAERLGLGPAALTYNAHRIHYDRGYARDAEGYPGLVVHGPLQALAMAETARAAGCQDSLGAGGRSFDYHLLSLVRSPGHGGQRRPGARRDQHRGA